jgi:hypothetical protein
MDHTEEVEVDRRNVRPRTNNLPQRYPPGNEGADHPMLPPIDPGNVPRGGQHRGSSSPSASPPSDPPVQPPWNADSNPDPIRTQKDPPQRINPPGTDGESSPALTEVNPEQGPLAGGARIWLKGIGFPPLFSLFARFGTAVAPTVSMDCFASTN